jgi:hypothetical protein
MSVVGRKHTGSGQGQPTDPDYRNAVEKLKSGEDLVWSAEPRVAAAALNEALNAVRAERDELLDASPDADVFYWKNRTLDHASALDDERVKRTQAEAEVERLRTALLSVAAFSKHPHPAPCGTEPCVLCLIESACAEALGDSA